MTTTRLSWFALSCLTTLSCSSPSPSDDASGGGALSGDSDDPSFTIGFAGKCNELVGDAISIGKKIRPTTEAAGPVPAATGGTLPSSGRWLLQKAVHFSGKPTAEKPAQERPDIAWAIEFGSRPIQGTVADLYWDSTMELDGNLSAARVTTSQLELGSKSARLFPKCGAHVDSRGNVTNIRDFAYSVRLGANGDVEEFSLMDGTTEFVFRRF